MKNTQAINVKAGNAIATGSVTVSDSMPGVPCPDPAGYKYVGARYVPLFADPAEWSSANTYEPLTIVLYEGNSYTSKQFVPVGIQIDNEEYWALTGNYNAQVEAYRREVKELSDDVEEIKPKAEESFIKASAYTTPEAYGAKGDGITDDSAAISAMFASGIGTYVFSNKTYAITRIDTGSKDFVVYGNGAVLSNIDIDSAKWNDEKRFMMTNYGTENAKQHAVIYDLEFKGNYKSAKGIGSKVSTDFPYEQGTLLYMNGGEKLTVIGCQFSESMQNAISALGIPYLHVEGCKFSDIGCVTITDHNYGGTNNCITHYQYILNASGQSRVYLKNSTIIHNTIENVRDEFIRLDNVEKAYISFNSAKNVQQHFVENFQNGTAAEVSNIICVGNVIDYTDGAFYILNTEQTTPLNVSIIGNTVTNANSLMTGSYNANRGGMVLYGANNTSAIASSSIITNNRIQIAKSGTANDNLILAQNTDLNMSNNIIEMFINSYSIRLIGAKAKMSNNTLKISGDTAGSLINTNKGSLSLKGNTIEGPNVLTVINVQTCDNLAIENNVFKGIKRIYNFSQAMPNCDVAIIGNIMQGITNVGYLETSLKSIIFSYNIVNAPKGTFNEGAIAGTIIHDNNIGES